MARNARTTPHERYSCMTAVQAASNMTDHGRKVHELPWLYLDSVGQEYGPVPGWTMREWLSLGRFPTGRQLRVRLPEWERHMPLHQLYPDLNTAFLLPPAWPDLYSDGVLQGDEADVENLSQGTGVSALARRAAQRARAAGGRPAVGGNDLGTVAAQAPTGWSMAGSNGNVAMGGSVGVPCASASASSTALVASSSSGDGERFRAHAEPAARISAAAASHTGMAHQTLPLGDEQQRRTASPPPQAQFVLERLMQEERLLPPPPPQPSQRQLRELLSQPQEGLVPMWTQGEQCGFTVNDELRLSLIHI